MKLATYNVWNENKGVSGRYNQLISEICAVDADVIALQEVTEEFFNDYLISQTSYKYFEYRKYIHENEGLAILSKFQLQSCFFLHTSEEFLNSTAINVTFEVDGLKFSLTNVHLPWDSAKAKETQIVAIDKFIHLQNEKVDFCILLGDFNGTLNSSVHRYLTGEQTINGHESNLYWNEITSVYAELNGLILTPTLDFVKNPRWKGQNTMYLPSVVDRIYILENWHSVTLNSVKNFGTDISPINGFSASDHYGVVTDIEFCK